MGIAANIRHFRSLIPAGVELVAVSKFHSADSIREAYDAGQRCFGESRVQELLEKIPVLPEDIKWHFIGHLQTNKVRQLIGKTNLIESVDSERLLSLIDRESENRGIISKVLLQVHIAEEETKFGFSPDELREFFLAKKYEQLKSTHICGLMGMATNTDDTLRVKRDFAALSSLFEKMKTISGESLWGFDKLSMGMSGDWELAVEEGANIVRIGSSIFGERHYV